MKLSISNIAWGSAEDSAVYALMEQYGYTGLDIAPSRVWTQYETATAKDAVQFKDFLQERSLTVAGMQSLLFGHPELVLFGDSETREKLLVHLKHVINLGSSVNASALVFGSPKNRIIGERTSEKERIAEEFFGTLGRYATEKRVSFALEPNPRSYGGDFLTTTEEAFAFVVRVGVPGLTVNLDMGTMIENGEDVEALVSQYKNFIGHVHVSLPKLAPVRIDDVHRRALRALGEAGYRGWVSIEMLTPEGEGRIGLIEEALRELREAELARSSEVV